MDIVDIANKKKASNFEVITSVSHERSVIFEQDSFKKIEDSSSQGTGIRVIHDNRVGFSFSNDLDDGSIVDKALESAKFGEKAYFSFAKNVNSPFKGKLYYRELEELKTDELISIGRYIIDKIKGFNHQIKVDTDISTSTYEMALKTSKGFSSNYKKSFFSIGISGLIAKDDQLLSISNSMSRLCSFTDGASIDSIIAPVLDKFKLSSSTTNIKTGDYKVIFTPRAFRTLVSILTTGLNGRVVQKGISPLCNRVNDDIISKDITLIDDGTIIGGLASSPFDGEGTPSKRNVLFNSGKLNGFIYDRRTASLLGESSTGNGLRGYSSMPSPGFRNLIIEPGNYSYEDLLSTIDEGLLVDQFIGAGQSNILAGEYSMNLDLAFKVENGEFVGRVKDVMMSGNVFNSLNMVLGIGDKLYREGSGFYPYILLDNLSISSKD